MFFAALLTGTAIGLGVFLIAKYVGPGGLIQEIQKARQRFLSFLPQNLIPSNFRKLDSLSDIEFLKTILHQNEIGNGSRFYLRRRN